MAEVKWINISIEMFEDEKVAFIESLPEGDKILNIWIRLICMAGKCNSHGYIFISQGVPCSPEYLSFKFRKSINVINLALETFKKLDMIEINEQGILLPNFDKHQYVKGLEKIREQTRQRVSKHREKIKELQSPAEEEIVSDSVTSSNVTCNATDGAKSNVTCSPSSSVSISNSISNNSNSTISNNNAKSCNYIDFFNNNFHLITPFEAQTLNSYVDDGMDPEVINLALIEAVENNGRDMKYIKSILNRWIENNLLTVKAVKAEKAEWQRKRNSDKEVKQSGGNKGVNKQSYTAGPSEETLRLEEIARKNGLLNDGDIQDIKCDF